MNLVKVISTAVEDTVRFVKILRYGKDDVQEVRESAPFGIDGNAPKDLIAIYSPTGEKGKAVVIGYINKNQLADVGELRMYSTDESLSEQFYIHLKNDGTAEFGGDSDFMVRYSNLETAFNELKGKVNTLVSLYNSHTHPFTGLIAGVPGNTSPTASTGTPSTANISGAKIDEIKTL